MPNRLRLPRQDSFRGRDRLFHHPGQLLGGVPGPVRALVPEVVLDPGQEVVGDRQGKEGVVFLASGLQLRDQRRELRSQVPHFRQPICDAPSRDDLHLPLTLRGKLSVDPHLGSCRQPSVGGLTHVD